MVCSGSNAIAATFLYSNWEFDSSGECDMAGEKQDNGWPLPKFSFAVIIEGVVGSFQEVAGLDAEGQVIEYRAGDAHAFSVTQLPGVRKYGNVTLKKGVFAMDGTLWHWFNQTKL